MKSMRLIIASLCMMFASIVSAQELPALTGHVNDTANVLTPDQRAALEAKLASFESATGNQIVILTIKSLKGETIAPYAVKVYKSWHLGEKTRNNGALFIDSIGDRKVWIATGYGLEGALPDARVKDIVLDITPKLKASDKYGTYVEAMDKIILSTKGEYKSQRATSANTAAAAKGAVVGCIIGFVVLFVVTMIAGNLHPLFGGVVGGGGAGLIVWLIVTSGFLIFLAIVIGFVVGLLAKAITSAGGSGGGWGDFSSFGSSGSDSGGGYSGGGGDTGGGGAGGDY